VGQSQSQGRTVQEKLVAGGKQESSDPSKSESADNKNDVVKSVLESFEKTQQKH
jgi:hypothetical protein